jgi:hypothetical protein
MTHIYNVIYIHIHIYIYHVYIMYIHNVYPCIIYIVCVCVCECKGGGGGGGAESAAGRACDAGPWGLTHGCQVWGRCLGVWVMVWGRCLGSGSKLNTHLTHGFRATAWVGVGQVG